MAKNAEMDAKDIAILFRSAVEAEDEDLLCETSTFAEQDFFIQLGWFTNQIEARLNLKKNTPSPDVLALIRHTKSGKRAMRKSEQQPFVLVRRLKRTFHKLVWNSGLLHGERMMMGPIERI